MNLTINHLLEKYWAAESTPHEEQQLKAYFSGDEIAEEHKEYIPLFAFYDYASDLKSSIDLNSHSGDNVAIDDLVSKYTNADTDRFEEMQLSAYLDGEVKEDHEDLKALFEFAADRSQMTTDIDIAEILNAQTDSNGIDDLIALYEKGETNLDQEGEIAVYLKSSNVAEEHMHLVPLFDFYSDRKKVSTDLEIADVLQNEKEERVTDTAPQPGRAKVFTLRRAISAMAAIFVIAFASYSVMPTLDSNTQYKGKYVQLDSEAETEEALEITREALAFLSKKMNKNTKTVKESVSKADAVQIFK